MNATGTNRRAAKTGNIIGFAVIAFVHVLLLVYLLTIDIVSTLIIGLISGIPIAALCHLFLQSNSLLSLRMATAMTAIGGLGMWLGCLLEIGPLGLYNLFDLCQTFSITSSLLSPEWMIQRFMLTPWTYFGMILSCNLGMWLFEMQRQMKEHQVLESFILYVACNIGMLAGMLLFERFVFQILLIDQTISNPLIMAMSMLFGMFLGMALILSITRKILFNKESSISFYSAQI